ncbi:MAG: hypothetical protein R6X34_10940 [Chloroflexota bacterium]
MMQGSNKFLFGIVIGIVLLVIITFSVVMLRPEPTYQDDSTPEGAAHNYLLAIQNQDYERAFSYIPHKYPYPIDAADMADTIGLDSHRFDTDSDFSLAVDSVQMRGEDKALVTVRKTTFYTSGLMGSEETSRTFTLDMILENGVWKVSEGESYWSSSCWGESRDKWCR